MEFKKKTISEICEIVTDYVANGSFKSLAENVKYQNSGEARVIRLLDFNNKYSTNDSIWVDEHGYEFLKKSKLYGGEIILTNVGANLGTVFIVPKLPYKMTLGPNAVMLKSKEEDLYLYYWLISPEGKNKVKAIVTGSAMPKFNKTDLKNIEIKIPSIDDQRKIVNVLMKIDKKIELNNQINDNLLNLGINKVLDEENIEKVQLKTLTKVISKGTTPTGSDIKKYPNKDIKFVKVKDFNEYGIDEKNIEFISNEIHSGKLKRSILLRDDLLVSIAGTLGKIAIVTNSLNNANTNQAVAFVRLEKTINKGYLYFYMNTKDFQEDIIKKQVYAVQPNLSLTELGNIMVPILNDNKKILYNGLLEKIILNIEENKRLEQLRDTLLPKLMNGEIDLDKIEI